MLTPRSSSRFSTPVIPDWTANSHPSRASKLSGSIVNSPRSKTSSAIHSPPESANSMPLSTNAFTASTALKDNALVIAVSSSHIDISVGSAPRSSNMRNMSADTVAPSANITASAKVVSPRLLVPFTSAPWSIKSSTISILPNLIAKGSAHSSLDSS